MNILKKILAFAIILWIFGQTGINSFANTNYELENIKYQLSNNNIDDTIKNKIDNFIEKIDEKKLDILSNKINKLKLSWKIKTWSKVELIVNYIELKIQERKLLKVENEKKDIFKNKLSEVDNKKVNEQLVKIQNNLLNRWVDSFEKILWKLETYTNYEQKGNLETSVNFDGWEMWTSKFQLKLKDYITKNSWFDTQFKSKIEAIIEAAPKWQKAVKVQINAFVDYILKNQNYYVLLKDLKITDDKWIEEIKQYVEKAKEIASKNKYIHFEDKNATQVLNTLKELNPQNILKQWKTIASKPLFRAYKKDWNKYYLVPSKYGCDTAKILSNKFDPFNGSACTDSQYEDLLKEIADSKVEFYIDFSKSNTVIGFNADWVDGMEKFVWDVTFSDKNIEEINITAEPNQEEYPSEWFTFNYKRNNFVNSKFYADKWKYILNLSSILDRNNNFSNIEFNANLDTFKWELTLNNKIITGKYSGEGYKSKIVWLISGKTDRYNKISQLKLNNQYISSSSYNPFENNTILEYDNWKYLVDNKYTTEWLKSTLNASFTINKNILTELNFNLDISQKESSYDYNSYKTVYTWDFKNIFNSNITLKNKVISWKTTINVDDKEYLNITNIWKYEKYKFELNNKIIFSEKLSKLILPTSWNKEDSESKTKPEANFNIKTDTTSNNNNLNIYIDYNEDNKKMLEIKLDNKSKKTYKDVKILAPLPNDTIELEDAVSNPQMY